MSQNCSVFPVNASNTELLKNTVTEGSGLFLQLQQQNQLTPTDECCWQVFCLSLWGEEMWKMHVLNVEKYIAWSSFLQSERIYWRTFSAISFITFIDSQMRSPWQQRAGSWPGFSSMQDVSSCMHLNTSDPQEHKAVGRAEALQQPNEHTHTHTVEMNPGVPVTLSVMS